MSAKVEFHGLAELRDALRRLPAQLTEEANAIVIAHADQAKREIQAAYPEGPTGNLKRGVTVARETSAHGARATVRSRAKHAHLFEFGTKRRQTDRGANRGAAPAHPTLIPIAQRARQQMYAALIDLVRRAGFEVSET